MSTTASTSSSVSSTVGPKMSKLVAKSGFVIPKNKLSGSLVPVSRGGRRAGGAGFSNEESVDPTQKKTRWGPDPCLDTAVRKARAVAYQTRVNQITEQLHYETLDVDGNEDISDISSSSRVDSSILELLQLERQETIAEIIRLNPSFKPPIDYKPILKEARVRIPVENQTSHHLLELILGPENETLKRLEQETGAKLQVLGTKSETLEEVEIARADLVSSEIIYKELSFSVAAETFEILDSAVSLIQLLMISLMENLAKREPNSEMNLSNVSPNDSEQAKDHVPHPEQSSNQASWSQLVASHGSQNSSNPLLEPMQTQSLGHSVSHPPFEQPKNLYGPMAPPSAEPEIVDFPSNQRPQLVPIFHQATPQDQFPPSGSSQPPLPPFPVRNNMIVPGSHPAAPTEVLGFRGSRSNFPLPSFSTNHEPPSIFPHPMAVSHHRFPGFNSPPGRWNPSPPFRAGMPFHHIPSGPQGNPPMFNNGNRFPGRFPGFPRPGEQPFVQMQPRFFSPRQPSNLPRTQRISQRMPSPSSSVSSFAIQSDELKVPSAGVGAPAAGASQVYDPFSPTSVAADLQNASKVE